jgi:hypothetical protein
MAAGADKKNANIKWFRDHLGELLSDARLRGKFVVVHDESVKASFDSFNSALREAVTKFPSSEFVVQQVIEDTATINYLRAAL